MRVTVEETGGSPTSLLVGSPEPLIEFRYFGSAESRRPYDLAPEGDRFLVIADPDGASRRLELHVVLNWDDELKRLVPTN